MKYTDTKNRQLFLSGIGFRIKPGLKIKGNHFDVNSLIIILIADNQ